VAIFIGLTRSGFYLEPIMDTLSVEKLVTLSEAAERLGVPYFKVQRAVRAGLIPTYTFYNTRRLVKMSEVNTVIDATRQGGRS
jgi:excisionase family DNA binding protein